MSYTATQARVGLGSELVLVGFPLASPPVADATIGEITDIVKSGAKADTISLHTTWNLPTDSMNSSAESAMLANCPAR
jgi:hypothetical protein